MSTTALKLHFPHVFSERIYNRHTGRRTIWFMLGVASMGAAVGFFSRSAFYHAYGVNTYNKIAVLMVFWCYLFYQFVCLAFMSETFELLLVLRIPIGIGNLRIALGALIKALLEIQVSLIAAVLLYILAKEKFNNKEEKTYKLNDGFGLVTMGVLALHFFLFSRVLGGRVLVVPLMAVCIDICLHMSIDRFHEKNQKYLIIVGCLVFLLLQFVRNICEMWDLDRAKAENQAAVALLNARIQQLEAQAQVPALAPPPPPLDHAGN